MDAQRPLPTRLYLTGVVLLAEGGHLIWEHVHGGVVRHHSVGSAHGERPCP